MLLIPGITGDKCLASSAEAETKDRKHRQSFVYLEESWLKERNDQILARDKQSVGSVIPSSVLESLGFSAFSPLSLNSLQNSHSQNLKNVKTILRTTQLRQIHFIFIPDYI